MYVIEIYLFLYICIIFKLVFIYIIYNLLFLYYLYLLILKAVIEDFYTCEDGEFIQEFEILENYGVALIKADNNSQYLKIYNFRTE